MQIDQLIFWYFLFSYLNSLFHIANIITHSPHFKEKDNR